MALWIAMMPAKARKLDYSGPQRDTWFSMELAPDGHWDVEWVGYDAQSNAFRIVQRIDPSEGAELTGGIGAFVKLTALVPGKRIAKKQPLAEEGDLMLEIRSYDRNGKVYFHITPTKMHIIKGQVLYLDD